MRLNGGKVAEGADKIDIDSEPARKKRHKHTRKVGRVCLKVKEILRQEL